MLAAAPKDGFLYGNDLESGEGLYMESTTRRENTDAPLTREGTRFCPGSQGGVFVGDMEGNAYALDAESGERLWSEDVEAAIAGGVISYQADGQQRIAFAAGMTSPIWPTSEASGRILVFGLPSR